MTFQLAERKAQPVLISLMGKSSSGKTFSSLKLARGLVGETGKIVVIDTEKGRGQMYAGTPDFGDYYHAELNPPFTPEAYIKKLEEAVEFGADCIIVDSISHEWSGQDGCLDFVDNLVAKRGAKHQMVGWSQIKPRHRRFINRLTLMPCHVICCVRAKDKLMEREVNGTKEWVMLPDPVAEQEKDFIYEMTAAALIGQDHKARWIKVPLPLADVLKDGMIEVAQGQGLREWVDGGVPVDPNFEKVLSELRNTANEKGTEAMRAVWAKHCLEPGPKGKMKQNRLGDQLGAYLTELQETASKTDAAMTENVGEFDNVEEA